ncbi:MAG: hypothetical protein J6Y94_00060, partial [Bacteriovoracaceae bacterium]|nr:hypothetical protein [Bacteriovoracaceae bacterium]
AGAPAPNSLPGPQLAAAAQVPANLSPTAAPPRVGPALQAAPLNEVKKQKSGQEMQVKTYGQVDEQREAPPRLQGPDKKQKNRKTGQQNKPAVPEQKVGEKPRVTPGQIVYYLPDYAQDHQVQREKIATFYEQQVAVMAATPTPKKFEPDYTTPSNTVVKVLGRKAGVGVAHAPAEQGRMEDKVEKGSSSVANRAVASAAEDAMAGAASAPAVKTTKVKTVVQADASSSSSAAAPQTEASGASAKRDVASVGQENRPLEQVTLEQFTQQMRLRNETDQLIHELQSYRIDRQGR